MMAIWAVSKFCCCKHPTADRLIQALSVLTRVLSAPLNWEPAYSVNTWAPRAMVPTAPQPCVGQRRRLTARPPPGTGGGALWGPFALLSQGG